MAGRWNSWKSLKNLKVGVFEIDFMQVPFVFRQTTCTYNFENKISAKNKWIQFQLPKENEQYEADCEGDCEAITML